MEAFIQITFPWPFKLQVFSISVTQELISFPRTLLNPGIATVQQSTKSTILL